MLSSSARNPCAYPFGTNNCLPFSLDNNTPNHFPKVGESGLTSATTSIADPFKTSTIFDWHFGSNW